MSQTHNPILKLLVDNVHVALRRNILFLEKWNEPPNFLFMPARERLLLMEKYRPQNTQPSQTNFWIWFGAYASKDRNPVFYNDRVPRVLYEAVNGPLLWPGTERKRRLVNIMTSTMADVNVYKYQPAIGARYKAYREDMNVLHKSSTQQEVFFQQKHVRDNEIIDQGVKLLLNFQDDFRTDAERKIALIAYSYEAPLIDKILKQYGDKYVSNRDTNGTPQSPTAHNHVAITDEISNPHESESITDTPLESLSEDVVQKP